MTYDLLGCKLLTRFTAPSVGPHAAGLKSNQNVVSYPHHNHGTVGPMGTSCLSGPMFFYSPSISCQFLHLSKVKPLLFFPLNSYEEMFIFHVCTYKLSCALGF